MKVAVEHQFTGATASLGVTYDSNKTMLGSFFKQYTGATPQDKYVSLVETAIINIPEVTGTSYCFPVAYKWSDNIYWIFMASNATAAATRLFSLFEFNTSSSTITYKGAITMLGTTIAGNKTVRGFRPFVYTHTNGTVEVVGTGVTGSGTLFRTDRIAGANGLTGGARIGFGSTYAPGITQWYEIGSVLSDTSLTLKTSVESSIPVGTPYVIEEIRLAAAIANAGLTTGGIHLIKGLNYGTFDIVGSSVPEAISTDNICGSYRLIDTALSGASGTIGIQNLIGLASSSEYGFTSHTAYALNNSTPDASTQVRYYAFNLRAGLTPASGTATGGYLYRTGATTITGTPSGNNNSQLFAVNHGAASGVTSAWFTTTTRLYRCAASAITANSTSYQSDFMLEIPPGGSNITYAQTNSIQTIDYSSTLDRILMSTGNNRFGVYIGEYDSTNTKTFDKIFGTILNRYQVAATSAGAVKGLFPASTLMTWTEQGYLFACPNTTTSGLNWLVALPIAGDGFYASSTNQRIITPKLSTLNATKLYRVYVDSAEYLGTYPIGFPTESYRVYYRLSGIDDNSGSWTEVPLSGDLTGIAPSNYIQFMIELDVMGEICAPNKIYNITCTYEDDSQDSHYQPSLSKSSASSRIFAWRQVSSWGGTIPNLQIRLYNASTGFLVLDDNVTSSTSGTFEYSTDGTTWNAWSSSADTVGNYIRYTATNLPNNITVRALLTQA